jgi:1,4-alpha-glucan branching enzyme
MYAFSENYVLPISHDEVVHGKLSFINKMHGSYEDKFDQARCALLMIMTYPGKKMLFMGTEYAQFREWDFENSLEWFMLDYEKHKSFRDYTAALNRFYLGTNELWELDFSSKGFLWIVADESEKNTVAFKRIGRGGSSIMVVINFSGANQKISLPCSSQKGFMPVFETSPGVYKGGDITSDEGKNDFNVSVEIPPFSGFILREIPEKKKISISSKK